MIKKYIFEFNNNFIVNLSKEYNFNLMPKRLFHNYDVTNQFVTSLLKYDNGQGVAICSDIEYAGMDDFPNDLWQKWEKQKLGNIKTIIIAIVSEEC